MRRKQISSALLIPYNLLEKFLIQIHFMQMMCIIITEKWQLFLPFVVNSLFLREAFLVLT